MIFESYADICDNPEPEDFSVEDQAAIDNVQDFVDWLNRFGGVNVEVGAESGKAWIKLNDHYYHFNAFGEPDLATSGGGAFESLWYVFNNYGHRLG